MKERIALILQKENMTAIQFAKKVGINPSSLSHILSGRNKASLEIVMKIHKNCPYVNLNWLLYGEGNMELTNNDNTDQSGDYLSISPFENSVYSSNDSFDNEYGKENSSESQKNTSKPIEREVIKYIEKPSKKITEIRIFYDNGTYETFKPDF